MHTAQKTDKLYYSISEVAGMFGVNTSFIRYWEKEFDIIKPYRNKKGMRFFTRKDVDNFHLIYHLVKERGYTLKGARERMKSQAEETRRDFELVKSLKKIRGFLAQLKQNLEERHQ
jgi:DNA-binding transcriptional MerR regulator